MHNYCATACIAPELVAINQLPGGWLMIVMQYLSEEKYTCLDKILTNHNCEYWYISLRTEQIRSGLKEIRSDLV